MIREKILWVFKEKTYKIMEWFPRMPSQDEQYNYLPSYIY